jgi:beta-glucanase (GH16 family)
MSGTESKPGVAVGGPGGRISRRSALAAGSAVIGAAVLGTSACSLRKSPQSTKSPPVGPTVGTNSFDEAPLAQQVLFDDFNGRAGSIPNPALWQFDLINQGGYQTYRANNAWLDGDSHMVFEATGNANAGYFSGGITSRQKFNMQYGTIAASIKVPKGPGFWPAFWLLGTGFPNAAGQPDCGEIDIFEIFGMPFSQQFSVQDHYWNSNGRGNWGYAAFPPGGFNYSATGPDLSTEFHTWWIQWTTNSITGGMDDTTFGTLTPANTSAITSEAFGANGTDNYVSHPGWSGAAPTDSSMQWVYNAPVYAIINFSLGASWLSAIKDSLLPATMLVDWFMYQPLVNGVPSPVPKF